MKPLKLEIQAFGPYVEKQTIDFEKLGEKGLFLIKGDTGSGKTTILDAMTFALFGGSTGDNEKVKSGRNDLEEWRCSQAGPEIDTIVRFVFSIRDRKFVFARGLTFKRKLFSTLFEAGEINEDGVVIPFFENPKDAILTAKTEELIGLTKEQFRQVVLLPQGQFERFLTADSGEKEEILQKIFESSHWASYAQEFLAEAKNRKDSLDSEKAHIIQSLEEDELSSVAELSQKIEDLKTEKENCKKTHSEFNGVDKQKQLEEDIKLAESFKPLHKLEAEKQKLDGQKSAIDEDRVKLSEAERAEKVRIPIAEYEKASSESVSRRTAFQNLEKKKPAVQKEKEDAEEAKSEHEACSPVAELNKKIGNYESKVDDYKTIGAKKQALDNAKTDKENAKTDSETAETNKNKAIENAKKAKTAFDDANAEAKSYRDKYFGGIYGEIAAELKDNEKCPICGSTNHPAPAKRLPDSVSKEDVESKEKDATDAKKKWDDAESKRLTAEEDYNKKARILSEKDSAYATAEAEYNTAAKNLIDGISDEKALNTAILKARNEITKYTEEGEKLQEKLEKASEALTKLKESINAAKEEADKASKALERADETLQNALKESGFSDHSSAKSKLMSEEERSELRAKIVEYDAAVKNVANNLAKTRKELAGKTEPDTSQFDSRRNDINKESEQYNKDISRIDSLEERLSKKLNILSAKQKHYDDNITQAESDLAFSKKLRGDTGIGLPRYVLAIMFNQVIAEANRMLSRVHGGRYFLFRSDDKGNGKKRGLELKVHDNRSPEKEGRSVAMLSGGEKFLVSLSLSIGMSTIAQKSGVQIESLFIDEGFGTLDDSSIQDAMDVLDSVRKGTGTIGIISHIPLLEANIPTHLEVLKKESGSEIVLN